MKSFNVKISRVLLLIILVFIHSCKRSNNIQDRVVTAAYVPAGYYLPFLVVESDGLLEKRGYSIELKRFNDNAHMINAFLNGHLDVTAQSAMTMFPVEQRHPGLFKFICGQYLNSYYFVVPDNSSMKTLYDLKGQTIGVWKSPTAEAYVKLLLGKIGLYEKKDYNLQRFGAAEIAAALDNNSVNVIFGFDVPIAKLVASGRFRYLRPDIMVNLLPKDKVFNGGAFINTRLISKNPKKAKAIRDALFEAIEKIRTDKNHVNKILAAKLGVSIEVASKAYLDEFTWPNAQLMNSAQATFNLLKEYDGLLKMGLADELDARTLFWLPSQ